MTCLLGKPPKPETVLDQICGYLITRKVMVQIHLPHESGRLEVEQWPEDTLVVHRGLNNAMLDELAHRETDGWRCCNSPASCILVQDRNALMHRLQGAGLPVPKWQQVQNWEDALRIAAAQPVVIKAADGAVGRGAHVVIAPRGSLHDTAPFSGPYLVEEHVENDGLDRKIYVAGSRCFGLIKSWPRNAGVPAEAFKVPPVLVDLALAVGAATGLEIFGVDVVLGPQGPVIVDVNVFPGFKGIDEAPSAVVDHLLERLGE